MNTECDNGISPQIRNDAYSFYFLTDQHNHKDSGKCGNVYLEYVAGIIVGPHTRRGGGEVHYHTQYSWTDYSLCKTGRFALYS